jgi:RND family efflux transporter MFP subunit
MTAMVEADPATLHRGLLPMFAPMTRDLTGWSARIATLLRGFGPYVLIELLLPGGSLIAVLLWLYRRRRMGQMYVTQGRNTAQSESGDCLSRKRQTPSANRRTCSPPREAHVTLRLMNIGDEGVTPQFSPQTSGHDVFPRLQFEAVDILGREHMRHSFSIATPAAVVLAIAAALSLTGCGGSAAAAQAAAAPPPPQVDVAQVVARKVTEFDEFTGRFEAVERVEVRPRVSGYIASVNFAEGREVKKGEVLFVIDPRPYEADYKHAKAQLDQARSQSVLAKSERERATKLLQAHAISQEEYDTRVAGLQQADANVEAAQAALDTAALNLSFTRVTAPISGRISRALVTEGNLVSAGQTMLTTLVSLDPIYVRFDGDEQAYLKYIKLARENAAAHAHAGVNAKTAAGGGKSVAGSGLAKANSSAAQVEPGEAGAEVMVGLADEAGYPHQGVMVFVDNELDPTTGTIRGRARLDNHDRAFTPGLFARVKLMGSNQYDALLINDSAIGTDQTVRYVLVVGADNKVQYRPVKLGPIVDGLRVVTDGLKPGETIVVNGLQRVRPGSAVNPERVAMGERERGDKPQTLFARNSRLAANTRAGNAVSNTSAGAKAGATEADTRAAAGASATPTANLDSSSAQNATTVHADGSAKPAKAAKASDRHRSHVALNTRDAQRPNRDAASSND